MKKSIIEFKNFSYYYNKKEKVLKNINFNIYDGEKVLILGSSGSGKTTLSKCINGVLHPNVNNTEGNLYIYKESVLDKDLSYLSKIVGTIMQDTDAQFVAQSVGEDIAFSLENNEVPNFTMRNIVSEMAQKLSINKLIYEKPHRLSGGQKQRVALAGVLVENSNILVLDEPLANLDPKSSIDIVNTINKIHKEFNSTIIIIEHRLEEVMKLNFDRIILLHDGEIKFNGKMNELLRTNILDEVGIREPLYVSLLKQIGADLTEIDLENFDSINFEIYKDKIQHLIDDNVQTKKENRKNIIEIRDLSYNYEQNEALQDVNLDIKEGEILSIIGKNGAGKSTLAKIITGFLKEYTGSCKYIPNNSEIKTLRISEISKYISYVMQNPNYMISESIVEDEIAFYLKMKNYENIDEKLENILKVCDLVDKRKANINNLSYGQKKRVTIASILVTSPKILILDEPTAAQDYRHYKEIMDFIIKIKDELNITMIIITHDMYLISEYSDRIAVFSDGKLLKVDKYQNIFNDDKLKKQSNIEDNSIKKIANKLQIEYEKLYLKYKGD